MAAPSPASYPPTLLLPSRLPVVAALAGRVARVWSAGRASQTVCSHHSQAAPLPLPLPPRAGAGAARRPPAARHAARAAARRQSGRRSCGPSPCSCRRRPRSSARWRAVCPRPPAGCGSGRPPPAAGRRGACGRRKGSAVSSWARSSPGRRERGQMVGETNVTSQLVGGAGRAAAVHGQNYVRADKLKGVGEDGGTPTPLTF